MQEFWIRGPQCCVLSAATIWILSNAVLLCILIMTCDPSFKPCSMRYVLICAAIFSFIILETNAHVAAWHEAMFCLNGNVPGIDNQESDSAISPLFNLPKSDWWFHHVNNCDQFPPAPGVFLELPARGSFTVEHAVNRIHTTTARRPRLGTFVDGKEHPGLGMTTDGKPSGSNCVTNPNLHAQNESMAAGTAFSISYQSDIAKVTMENLVVFSVLYNTPWRRLATYDVPDLPACPPGGCICAWSWVPNGCGEPNMFMEGFRCTVTNVNPQTARPLGFPKPAVWCEDNNTACLSGPKQIISWNQAEGNNIQVTGHDKYGNPKSPGYNMKLGFRNGAQTDIFLS